jgi:hypothetical protein
MSNYTYEVTEDTTLREVALDMRRCAREAAAAATTSADYDEVHRIYREGTDLLMRCFPDDPMAEALSAIIDRMDEQWEPVCGLDLPQQPELYPENEDESELEAEADRMWDEFIMSPGKLETTASNYVPDWAKGEE